MKTPAQIQFSTQVTAFCIVALLVMGLAHCATAQTVEHRKAQRGSIVKWNQAAYFDTAPKLKPFDWSGYGETWDGKQFTIWAMYAGAGVAFGMREAYHADPYVFERKWGVGSESFFGSDAWKRNYVDNNPDLPHKHEYFGNVGRDVWHTFGFASNAVLLSGSFAIGARKQPWKYKGANFVIALATRSLFASLTYNAFR